MKRLLIICMFVIIPFFVFANTAEETHINYIIPKNIQSSRYFVQGVASSCEAMQNCKNETIYISFTHSKNDSIILAYNKKEKKPKACYTIDNDYLRKTHVGGLAYYKNKLYVSSENRIAKLSLPELNDNNFDNNLTNCKGLHVEKMFEVIASSYVSTVKTINQVNYLFVGRYCDRIDKSTRYCKDENGIKLPYAYLYRLDNNGDIKLTPESKYIVPFRNQGVDLDKRLISKINSKILYDDYMVTSINNASSSAISWYKLSSLKCSSIEPTFDCPKYQDDLKVKKHLERLKSSFITSVDIEPESEDLAVTPSKIWTGSEVTNNEKIIIIRPQDIP